MEPGDKRSVRIVVADDNESTLQAMTRFLQEERYSVVGTVPDGSALVNEVARLAPDLAVVDITMPGVSGIEAVVQLKQKNCGTKFVMLTVHREPEFVKLAFDAGACGYVLKHRVVTDLPAAIESALRGERFLSPPLTDPAATSV